MSREKVIVENCRFNWLQVWEPKSIKGSKEKYSVSLMIPKSDIKTVEYLETAIDRLAKEAGLKGKIKSPLHDGDTDRPEYPEYADHMYINPSSKLQPWLYNSSKQKIDSFNSEQLYSGCWGRASIILFTYNSEVGKGVGCLLNGLQKMNDGERLDGGQSNPEDDLVMGDANEDII